MSLVTGLDLMGGRRGTGLLFNAPFDDPDNPLRMIKGGPLTMARATTATFLNPTTGLIESIANDTLRIEADGALIEEQRENLLKHSESLDASPHGYVRASVGPTSVVAPDGDADSPAILEDGTAANNHIKFFTFALSDNTVYAHSIFAKAGTRDWVSLETRLKDGSVLQTYFDLAGGVKGATAQHTFSDIIGYDDGWYRVWVASDTLSGATTPKMDVRLAVANGDQTFDGSNGAESIYAWGEALEVGAFPLSYIPTMAAAVTRNADILSLAVSGNIDETVGTVFFTFDQSQIALPVVKLGDGTQDFILSATNQDQVKDGTNTVTNDVSNIVAGTTRKVAVSWTGTTFTMVADGGTAKTGTFDGNLSLATTLYIGSDNGTSSLSGHIKPLKIYDVALSVTQMQNLTG